MLVHTYASARTYVSKNLYILTSDIKYLYMKNHIYLSRKQWNKEHRKIEFDRLKLNHLIGICNTQKEIFINTVNFSEDIGNFRLPDEGNTKTPRNL